LETIRKIFLTLAALILDFFISEFYYKSIMYRKFQLLLMVCALSLAGFAQGGDVTLDTVDNYSDWGWQCLVVENSYIQLVIVPELGGRVLYYGMPEDEYMWINPDQLGKTYDPDVNVNGPWGSSSGYGGYKVWPAPQDKWNWPPPPHLAWGPYTYTTEVATADSVVIYLRSQVETSLTPGLQMARRYKVYRNSTRVKVEQILIWDVTQATVRHEGESDYASFSTYFPASLNTLNGKGNGTFSAVDENITKYQFVSGKSGKMFSFLSQGWMTFVDERDEQSYTKIFEIFPENNNYPDDNSNFEIYSSGGNYIELEVLSPIESIGGAGDSISFGEYWYAAKVNGSIKGANHAGIIREKLNFDKSSGTLSGEFGIFNNGSLRTVYYDKDIHEVGSMEATLVNATEKYTVSTVISLPENAAEIRILAFDSEGSPIGILDAVSTDPAVGLAGIYSSEQCKIYPTLVEKGMPFSIQTSPVAGEDIMVEIHSLADGKDAGNFIFPGSSDIYSVTTDLLVAGIYIVTVRHSGMIFREKMIIL
jgi:hypothetical protein